MAVRQDIKRKKVTRVGSGAYSIYLPKKWIDSWPPKQQESREVDLHHINEALLIVPAHLDQQARTTLPDDVETVCGLLRSAYVRGLDGMVVEPQNESFGAETIAAARDLLRHLDERLIVESSPERISFSLDPNLPPNVSDGADLLRIMTAKVRDMTGLCQQAVDTHQQDPDRSLHALSLLVTTQREDVRRLFHQALRMVARIELPMRSVSDFQVLDLLAADLERFGSHLVRIAEILLKDMDLTLDDLAFPRSHLLKTIGTPPTRTPMVNDLVRNYRQSFEAITIALESVMDAVHERDTTILAQLKAGIMDQQDAMAERFFATVAEHWGDDIPAKEAIGVFTMARVASMLADLAHALQNACHHALILLTAEPRTEDA